MENNYFLSKRLFLLIENCCREKSFMKKSKFSPSRKIGPMKLDYRRLIAISLGLYWMRYCTTPQNMWFMRNQSAYLERILDSVYYHLGFVDLFYGISFVPFIQFRHVVFAIANGCQRSYCTFVRTLRVRQLGCKIISQLVHSIHSHSFTHSHSQQQINGKSNSDTVAHMRIESIDATLNFVCSLLFIDTDIRCGRLWYFSPGITLAVSSPPLTFLTLTRFILNL